MKRPSSINFFQLGFLLATRMPSFARCRRRLNCTGRCCRFISHSARNAAERRTGTAEALATGKSRLGGSHLDTDRPPGKNEIEEGKNGAELDANHLILCK
ncbi:hypothetical protein [Pseudoalteromonas sp.]|uniref:hypothetical protein n=1 Tax=Pseudoalteromonas sp. TaxID=53249 RepID=UPI002625BBAE|nr:hypothetical protein [Pseudoalteromonas sp.]MCP4587815.1 hypothetical protein [Pseudoalteromonas sp.]